MKISVKNLNCSFFDKRILKDVSACFQSGELTCVLGPNGSGKTSLLKCLLGLTAYSGEIEFNDASAASLSYKQRARELSYVPQRFSPPDEMPVLSFIRTAAYSIERRPKDSALAEVLSVTGCSHLSERLLGDVSGGEFQSILLAAALYQNSNALLMDEPFSAMDSRRAVLSLDLLRKLRGKQKLVIAVMHDINTALRIADNILYLHDGNLLFYGTPTQFSSPAQLKTLYGDSVESHEVAGSDFPHLTLKL